MEFPPSKNCWYLLKCPIFPSKILQDSLKYRIFPSRICWDLLKFVGFVEFGIRRRFFSRNFGISPDKFIRQQIGADSQSVQNVAADLEQQFGVFGVILGRRIPPVVSPEFQKNWEKRKKSHSPNFKNLGETAGNLGENHFFGGILRLNSPQNGFGKSRRFPTV